ncbi:LysR family transcriptional regulator [Pigmentiphaga soli]|uniref:LysR family transcriptional regulator n=1 Tax=Pigmentiphaga soli TaxID=1007095 RepID=A0ABP8H4E6_9BURK
MKLQYLHTLSVVIAKGSLTAGAQEVNLSTSAVSLQMRQLEEYFRQPLFDRSGRSIRPTEFARALAATAERAMGEIEAMRDSRSLSPAGRVRLGITESVEATLFPRAYATLRRRTPQIELQVRRGHTASLLQSIKAGELDIALLVRPTGGITRQLAWSELWRQPFVLVVPRDAQVSTAKAALRAYPWIRISRQLITGRLAARYVDALIPHCPALVDLENIDCAVALVAEGVGVAVLPKLRPELLDAYPVREIALGSSAPTRQLMLVKRRADEDNRRVLLVEAAFEEAVSAFRA